MKLQTYIDTVKAINAKYNALMFSLRASLPDATESAMASLSDALADALTTPKVLEAMQRLEDANIIASVREGVEV